MLNKEIIIEDDPNWAKKLQNYQNKKQVFYWPEKYFPSRINQIEIKKIENSINPITQKYKDDSKNILISEQEKKNLKDSIALNYDNQLRNEQTFNIINLDNKLKALNYSESLPKNKETLNKEISKVSYNILSNLPLNVHHFDKYENRPKINEKDFELNIKEKKFLEPQRDFNIINNNYHEFNTEKKNVEKEIECLQAAKNFLEKSQYDLIKGKYYDKTKEENYIKQIEEDKKNWEKNHSDHNHLVRNPINNQIYDKQKQNELDNIEKNKKRRFMLKDEIDNYYHSIDYSNEIRNENFKKNRISYNKFKVNDLRGYDFINFDNVYSKYKDNNKDKSMKNLKTDWEMLLEGKGENETFSKKQIFKEPYDKSDMDLNKHNYMKNRAQVLRDLPVLNKDKNFGLENKKIYKSKINNVNANNDNNYFDRNVKDSWNKKEWFGVNEKNYYLPLTESNNNLGFKKIYNNYDAPFKPIINNNENINVYRNTNRRYLNDFNNNNKLVFSSQI